MKRKRSLRKLLSVLLSALLAGALLLAGLPFDTALAEPTPPAAVKTLTPNGDGTYTLSLSVTGQASTVTEYSKADVIIVADISGSMNYTVPDTYSQHNTGRYGLVNEQYVNLYYYQNNQYRQLNSDTYTGTVYTRTGSTYTVYTGQRYIQSTRLIVAQNAITTLAGCLLANNGEQTPDMVQLSLVSFSTLATTHITGTRDLTSFNNTVNGLTATGGTNWEDALEEANGIATREDADVYVIFVSDGDPTYRNTQGGSSGDPEDQRHGSSPDYYYGSGNTDNNGKNYLWALQQATAIVNAGKHFYGVGTFGSVTRMQSLVTDAGEPLSHYHDATDPEGLEGAFSAIVHQITNTIGYTAVKFNDSVTSMTSSFVNTDPSSFTYMRSGGAYGAGELWTGAEVPQASYTGGVVTWDLGDMLLEDGVTYTVSFTVWPSQEAYDLVADLNNGLVSYDSLTDEQKEQIAVSGNSYALKTNLDASLDYTQVETIVTTTEPEGYVEGQPAADGYTYTYDPETGNYTGTKETPGSVVLPNPDPMPLTGSTITLTKEWVDTFDPAHRPDSATLNIMSGDQVYMTVTLNDANNWQQEISIAPGVIAQGETLETGHLYSVAEPDIDEHYELEPNSFHPMVVEGTLIANYQPGAGAPSGTTITARNHLKGGLEITKTVTADAGLTAPANAAFEMKITLMDGNEAWNGNANGATYVIISAGGIPSEQSAFPADGIIVLTAGEKAVISNIPSGISYTVAEQNIPGGFTLAASSNATGTIAGNENQTAAFTNHYSVDPITDAVIPVTKVLSVPQGLTGPADITGAYTFTLTGEEGAPMPATTSVTNPAPGGGTAAFGPITYTAPGTYQYSITESGAVAGVTNDAGAGGKAVTVYVEDNGQGGLTASVSGADATADTPSANTTFTNTYDATDAHFTLYAAKRLETEAPANNPPDVAGRYTLTLEGAAGAPMPAGAVNGRISVTNPDGNGTPVSFGAITFTTAGIYQYTVSESGTVAGVTNGQTSYTVRLQVTDNQDGTMSAAVITGGQTTTFTNIYRVGATEAVISANKELTGANLSAGAFSFTLAPVNGAPMPNNATATNDANGGVHFDEITYTAPGVYNYTVTEVNGGLAGYTYDNKTLGVTVTVTDNGNGTMSANVQYDGSTTFNNSYEATGRVHVTAMKYLSGRALADGQFSFTLTPGEGAPGTEQTKTNNAAGQVVFEDLCFCEADLGTTIVTNTYALRYLNGTTGLYEDTLPPGATDNGDGTWTYTPPEGDPVIYTAYYVNVADENDAHTTLPEGAVDNGDGTWTVTTETQNTTADFTYTITEVTGSAAGYTYDSHTETITVTVVDNGDGTMTATATYDADGAVFNNSYAAGGSVSLGGIKTVTGRAIAAEQFTFNLLDSGNNVIRTAKNDAAGNYTFSALSYTQSDAGKTYTYTIVEVNDGQGGYTYDSKVCTVTVSITDNGDGTLTVTPNYSPNADFNNTYAATGSAVIGGTKTLNGRALAAYQFTFNLLDSGDNVIQTAKNDAAGNYTFAAIHYTLADLGSHTYTIVEADDGQPGYTYDNKEITVTVNVTDNGDGTLTATPSYSPDANFTNNYAATGSVTIGGRKTLNGRIPAANRFTFNLLDSGDNVIRTAQNNASGSFTFDVIQYTLADLGSHTYTIVEVDDGQAGFTYDNKEVTVTVNVTDNGDGTLTATPSYSSDANFANTYAAAGSVSLGGRKTLSGRILAESQFAFNLLDSGNNVIRTAQNDASGNFTFGAVDYTLADVGIHTYTIIEVNDAQAGYTYDSKEVAVTVTVTDNGDGTLTATPRYNIPANFSNAYAATGSVTLGGTKTLNGGVPANGQFTFNLLDSGDNVIRTAQNDAFGNFTFSALNYTQADVGNHSYTIAEVNDGAGGYTYDSREIEVTVTVTDNGDGTLTATPSYNIPADFENTYEAAGSVTLGGSKTLNGRILTAGQFTFNLLDAGRTTILTAQNDALGNFAFDPIHYTLADVGSRTYYIVERDDGQAGYTYDSREIRVIVTVVDNGDGTLTATPNYTTSADFTNTYAAAGSATIGGTKTLNGGVPANGQFTFNLLDSGDNVIRTAQNDAFGNFAFSALNYTQADTGIHTYTIVEVNDGTGGYTYDSREIEVTVIVTDNGDGTLTATPRYDIPADFANTYEAAGSATIGGTKTVNGGAPAANLFTFNLLDSGRTTILTAQNDAEGNFAFDPIHYTLADVGSHTYYIVEADDGQAGYTYDNREVRVIVTVIDNGDGTLTATPSYNIPADFENTYTAAGSAVFGGTKALHNGTLTDGQFAFSLLNESRTAIRTTRNDAAGNFTFPAVNFTEADLGRTHTFYIAEVNDGQAGITYDNHECVITVTLTDNGDGTLTPNIEYAGGAAFVNTVDPRISVSVTKIWVDEEGNHPASLYVQLYRDGIAYESAVLLNAANNWTHTWTDLLDAHTWTVDELRVPNGYTKRVTRSGNNWTITNVRNPIPKTGDDSRLFLWLSVMALGAAGIVGVVLYISKKRQRG